MIIINSQDCATTKKGTGVVGCYQKLGQPSGFMEVDKTWSADITTEELTLAYFQVEQQKGNFVPFFNATGFEDTSEESVFETFTTGQKAKVRSGLPELSFHYKNGYGWHSQVYTRQGFNNKAIVLVWDNGVFGFEKDGNTIKGLERSYLEVKNFKNNDGTASSSTMIAFQLSDAAMYNSSMALIDDDTLDFTIKKVNGVVDYNVEFVAAPVNAATTCQISVLAEINASTFGAGLTGTDIKISGKTVTDATADTAGKFYTVTVDAAFTTGETHTPKLNDDTYDTVLVGEALYKGTGATTTVVA